ncbi:MAG TPA: hypothetical protein VF006_24980 [Longimicrobium sp.]
MKALAWIVGLMLIGGGALPCAPEPFCKCGLNTVEAELARSDAVFTGVVLRVGGLAGTVEAPAAGGAGAAEASWPVALRVDRVWKGAAAGDSIVVADVAICAIGFRPGEPYLVYALRDRDGVLRTSYCMRTRALEQAAADVPLLDAVTGRASRP